MAEADTGAAKDKILVFGGNGFIGSELVWSLIAQNRYDLYIVSRGNWYFDSESRIRPFVTHLVCDRENSDLDYCTDLMKVIGETAQFKIVFDFSAYKPEVLEEALQALAGKVGLYVYISSDSIYEVCEERGGINGGRSREIDGVRPATEEERDRLNDLDEYGNEKLIGEEVLVANRAAGGTPGGTPYLIVRLPDVLGPRDNTDRIWTYILWIQFYDFIQVPIFVPEHIRSLKTSYVYVKDVVRALFHLIDSGIQDEVYNVGFEQTLTLQELLEALGGIIGTKISFNFSAGEIFNVFPSVTRGGVDISKLKGTGFQPTEFQVAMNETVGFYKEAFFSQVSERDDAVHQLTKYVIGRERKGEFLKYIDQVTSRGPNPSQHTEL